MSSITAVVNPDLSRFVEDGKFDAAGAFEDYLCSLGLFIFPAIEMLKQNEAECDYCGAALDSLETLKAGMAAMESEILKLRTEKAA